MKIFEKIWNELFFAGLTREDYRMVKNEVAESNRKSLADWSVSVGFFWVLSLFISLRIESYALCRAAYTAGLVHCTLILLCAVFLVKRVPWTIFPLMYLFDLSMLGTGIQIAFCQPTVRTVTMIVIAATVPVCFIGNTISCVITLGAAMAAFAALGKPLVAPDIYVWSLLNLAIFSVAGILIGHKINKARFERYVYAESVKQLADLRTKYAYYDQMTGLQNRRAYSETLERLSGNMPRNCCVIMADINGLKAVNDAYGHSAGDELIIGASERLRMAFEGIDTIYRLGGDEFCVIMEAPAEKARRCLERLEWAAANWKGRYVSGVSISYGMGSSEDCADIDSIVKEADMKMYEYKRNYYMTSGKNRRSLHSS